jgi:hypothetical protein
MPARLRDIITVLRRMGIRVDEPKKGSHSMVRCDGARPYPLSAHNRLKSEISER